MNDRRLADELHDRLAATEELAIDHRANRWLGEAQAVADAIREEVPAETRREGAQQVVQLLNEIEATGNAAADEHVERALVLAERLAQT